MASIYYLKNTLSAGKSGRELQINFKIARRQSGDIILCERYTVNEIQYRAKTKQFLFLNICIFYGYE